LVARRLGWAEIDIGLTLETKRSFSALTYLAKAGRAKMG